MKKLTVILSVLILIALTLTGCAKEDNPPEQPSVITVSTNTRSEYYVDGKFYISDLETDGFDYSKLFVVLKDGKTVTAEISKTDVDEKGEFTVTCSYGGKSATATVVIRKSVYELNLSVYQISVRPDEALSYDYLSLFTATVNGQRFAITEDMITSNVSDKVGTYHYTVTFHQIVRKLTVVVQNDVVVTPLKTTLTLQSKDLDGYDFTSLFEVSVNGRNVIVTSKMIDLSELPIRGGKGTVTCTFQNVSASVIVTVEPNDVVVFVKKSAFSLNVARVANFDFVSLFGLTVDGAKQEVTADMIVGEVQAKAGAYTLSLTFAGVSASVTVTVVDHPVAQAIANYPQFTLTADQVANFDYTQLFAFYLDEESVPVTADMVDASEVLEQQGSYKVKLTYVYEDGNTYVAFADVVVGDEASVQITAINTVVYPNSAPIDTTKLFVVVDNGKNVDVTTDMVSGEIDYFTAGEYPVTLSYNGYSATATVEVKYGVVIVTASDTVEVKRGTNKYAYDFASDFKVVVNGVRLTNIEGYISGLEQADFDTVGAVNPITVTVNYNTNALGLGGSVKFTTTTATISYKVVQNTADIKIVNDYVRLDKGTSGYNPLSNIKVYLNGNTLPVTLTQNPAYADSITCYVDADTIDFASTETQIITLRVYVNGPSADPVEVSFAVTVAPQTELTAEDTVIFTDSTLFTTALFKLTVNGVAEEITPDMVYGRVDVFTPGVYTVSCTANGLSATARVVVLDKKMVGTYNTQIKTVSDSSEGKSGVVYGDLIIRADGTLTADNRSGYVVSATDQSRLSIKLSSDRNTYDDYVLYYDDGIVVLDYVNELKLGMTNKKRSLVYFAADQWTIASSFVLNTLSQHILEGSYTGWTAEMFKIESADGRSMWYALKTRLSEKTSADTVYKVTWGEADLSDGFRQEQGENATMIFDDEYVQFVMEGTLIGKTLKGQTEEKRFAGRTFSGMIDGVSATLSFDSSQGLKVVSGGTVLLQVGSYELSSMKNGGANYLDNTFFVYKKDPTSQTDYYSYKFKLDLERNSFTLIAKDKAFGYYTGNNSYIYLDGYGSGEANFNVSANSYSYVTQLTYTTENNVVKLNFVDYYVKFEHGTEASFYLSDLLNTLTAREIVDSSLIGKQFVNQKIVDGAVVSVNSLTVGKNSNSSVALQQLLDGITVITKDGEWSTALKKSNIDVKAVKFSRAGVYRFTVKVSVGGKTVSADYAVQVLDNLFSDFAYVGSYSGVFVDSSLVLDEFGRATFVVGGSTYTGVFRNDNSCFTANVSGADGRLIVVGKSVSDGVVSVTYTGAVNGKTLLAKGTIKVVGGGGIYLTQVVYSSRTYLFGSDTDYCMVNLVSQNGIEPYVDGALVSFSAFGNDYLVQISEWNNKSDGLTFADKVRGEYIDYKDNDAAKLVVDGFGTLVWGDKTATYVIANNGSLYAVVDGIGMVFSFNSQYPGYFVAAEARPTAHLLENKTFTATYKFYCGTAYDATTSFTFYDGGRVVCKSVCPEHDSGEYACEDDLYECPIGDVYGIEGTYTTDGNKVTVVVNGITIVFQTNDYVVVTAIVCVSTDIDSNAHGYFRSGTSFARE